MSRLNNALLPQLAMAKPTYDRTTLKAGIVHLGIGAFHRAHQAVYTDAVMNRFGGDWGIIGCSLRSMAVQQQLNPQDGLYTVLERCAEDKPKIIGSVLDVIVGPDNPSAIINAIASPDVKIVTLTITEKGYCHHPATLTLNLDHIDIQYDIQHPLSPITAPGFLVAGLSLRYSKSLPPITLISCDNLTHNGKVLRNVVTTLAERLDPELANWIKTNIAFPDTMVDRIVPATKPEELAWIEKNYDYSDEGLVVAEPFSQWVIQNTFCNDRPAWEDVGVLLVDDVSNYETMKLRLLNSCHSLLAYTGYLAGYETIFKAMQDPRLADLTHRFMQQAASTLAIPGHFDLAGYQQQLMERFNNPGLQHRTWQIAMDGTQKIAQRWLATLRELMHRQQDTTLFAFALAAWMRYLNGTDEKGDAIVISDPMSAILTKITGTHEFNYHTIVTEIFNIEAVFSSDFKSKEDFIVQTAYWLEVISTQGIRQALQHLQEKIIA